MDFTRLLKDIFDYDPDGPNIHHLMAVHEYCPMIAMAENVDEHTLFITEAAAYLNFCTARFEKKDRKLEPYFLDIL